MEHMIPTNDIINSGIRATRIGSFCCCYTVDFSLKCGLSRFSFSEKEKINYFFLPKEIV